MTTQTARAILRLNKENAALREEIESLERTCVILKWSRQIETELKENFLHFVVEKGLYKEWEQYHRARKEKGCRKCSTK